jgi:alcohol dehydrogenase
VSQFAISTNVYWGQDRYEKLSVFLRSLEINRVIFIVDRGVVHTDSVTKISNFFEDSGYKLLETCVPKVIGEPSYDDLDILADEVKLHNPDMIVGIGGGTVLDLAKGVSVLMHNTGKGIDYRGMNKVLNAPVPFIAVPTTAGSGSEVTWTAAFIDNVDNKKLGINGKNVAPTCALLEPDFLIDCPVHVAVGSGLDAMVHSAEAVTAKTASLFTEHLGGLAFSIMYEFLPKYVAGERSEAVCEQLLLSSYIAGIAMMNAGGGPSSGISYPLGVHYKVPHGFAGGVFLPHVFRVNVKNGYQGYEILYHALHDSIRGHGDPSNHFLDLFDAFYESVGGPKNLDHWECKGDIAIKKLFDLTLSQRMENLELNPVEFSKEDLKQVLESVCTK